ncbi:glutamate 5-kinase [Limibaculum sp. M0105]|uniref:Glutamate 5-kinase n=1 Tax=Thermohalobaculum xanthum TaxID=2753746 RepID=A0A8J7SEF6_9RHOB|nr:glutamate 5-kinase [Thermohalobaculum xanthum]MBK0397865.1 glutamate 5-kinase [Thermohalobaculum xanthum]
METLKVPVVQSPLEAARRLVVKVGSALLVDAKGDLRAGWLAGLAEDIAAERAAGRDVVVVSSGAIALGRGILGLGAGHLALEHAQAAAAIGQMRLARAWEEALSPLGYRTAQVLLTLDDTQRRRRYLNGKATLEALMGFGAIPVVNENDTTATDEIRYGDNDRLAARVALMAGADALVLLSDVDGLYTANPRVDPEAQHLPEVTEITPEIEAMAGDAGSGLSRGGMKTKILAAKTAMQGGCAMAIAAGACQHPLRALHDGARVTWFRPRRSPSAARKQWIAGMKPMGQLVVDAGAVNALRRGSSLLPAGVRAVGGNFERGDPVAIVTETGEAIGAALSGYSSTEATLIAGVRSERIEAVLGHPGRAAIAHRDDMVIWGM